MKLFIMRHGEAEPFMQPDADRELTVKGAHDAQSLGKKLKAESVQLDSIVISPFVRTRQTLDNFQVEFCSNTNNVIDSAITPNGIPDDVYELLSGFDENSCVMLISHLPLVSILIADLVAGAKSNVHQYPMAPASLAEIDIEHCGSHISSGCGVLKRLISPPYDV